MKPSMKSMHFSPKTPIIMQTHNITFGVAKKTQSIATKFVKKSKNFEVFETFGKFVCMGKCSSFEITQEFSSF